MNIRTEADIRRRVAIYWSDTSDVNWCLAEIDRLRVQLDEARRALECLNP